MDISCKVRSFRRITPNLTKHTFYPVTHEHGDLIITEYYEGEGQDIHVNISTLLKKNLSEDRYQIFRYGKEKAKEEKSCFIDIKGHDFKERKADITLLIFDKQAEKIYLVCGEVKKTLKETSFAEAREQLLSSHIDLNIFNALISYNFYPIERIFFIAFEEKKLLKKPLLSSAGLARTSSQSFIPFNLINEEIARGKIYFNLDLKKDIREVDKDLNHLENEELKNCNLEFIQV